MFVGFPTVQHATYSCPCEKHGSQCCHAVCETFPRKDETGWEGRRKFHVNTGSSDTHKHTHDSQGWQPCVVIPLAKHLAGMTEKFKKANLLSLVSVRKKNGRRIDRFYVMICMNATQLQGQFIMHVLPVSSGVHFHTHAFRSLLRVFCALTTVHVTPVTSHQYAPHHGYDAATGDWRRQSSTAHESALASHKIGRKDGKVEILWARTHHRISSRQRGRCVQSLAQIGSEIWICISSIQTNKQTFIFIYKIRRSQLDAVLHSYYLAGIF
jgi:hypothetical protein